MWDASHGLRRTGRAVLPALCLIGAAAVGLPVATAAPVVRVQAASGANVLRGAAKIYPCASCFGGALVRWIGFGGSLNMVADVPAAGSYRLAIAYSSAHGSRLAFIRMNFDLPIPLRFAATSDWSVLSSRSTTVHLGVGINHIAFTNPSGWCPDVNMVTISR